MEVIISKNAEEASALAAGLVAKAVNEKPDSVLGLATGSTPLKLYERLAALHRAGGLDFSRVRTFNLDEYIGLTHSDPASYNRFMRDNFFDHVNVPEENIKIPDGMAPNIPAFCRHYESVIKGAGGIDLQILGIGANGHIGFNEPSSSLVSRTRIKALTKKTIEDNARFFGGEESKVPPHVITMGIGTIMDARVIVMMAFGKGKAQAVSKMVEGPVTASVPASVLQAHARVKVFLDEEAASQLSNAEYYKWVYERKPAWERGG